jgi:diguanylate cyclase (GGDEF)-like protein/PAS domain S-box-containing protein
MFRWFLSFFLFLFFSVNTLAALNESTKPSSVDVYLDQNFPYSGFNSDHKAIGLYVDYWLAWSLKSGIPVTLLSYQEQKLNPLLSSNDTFIYSGLFAQNEIEKLPKVPLVSINTDFFYLSAKNNIISQALVDDGTAITIGGLLPNAQQLPILKNRKNITYQSYPGLLELFIDIYNNKLDAIVLFDIGKDNENILSRLMNLFLNKVSVDGDNNQLFAYSAPEHEVLLDWIQWGNQSQQLSVEMQSALIDKNNPWWGTSSNMGRNVFLVCGLIFILFIMNRSKRKKDYQFKDVLDSSPYPLAILTLDGSTIFYLNDEVKSLFPFKKSKNQYIFEDAENQLLLSSFINKASHQTVIENGLVHLLVNDTFHDIEIFAKRTHYKRQTAWLCHLKDVTALLRAERELKEERELLRKVLDSIPEQISFKSVKGSIIGCNTAWAEANNTTVGYATGRSVTDMVTPTVLEKQKQQEAAVWIGETYNTQEWVQQNNTTESSLVNVTKVPLYNDKGGIFAILSIDSDITALHNLTAQLRDENLQRKETEKALSKQSVLLSTVFAASYDPIGLLDDEGRIIGANISFAKLIDSNTDDIIGKLQSEVLSPDRRDWAERQNQEILNSGEPITFEEVLFTGPNRTWYEVHKSPFYDAESNSRGIVIMARDITAHKLTEEKLTLDASDFEQKMLNDQLTNIANRRSFDERFTKLWQECKYEREMLSIVMCDIDYFKPYNDNYGHQKGDEALKIIASALQSVTLEIGGFVARYGGEEFVIIIKGGNVTKVFRGVEKIHAAINETKVEHLYSDVSQYITVSMGLSSIFPSELNTMNMLVAEADAALYDAKISGRDQISVHK